MRRNDIGIFLLVLVFIGIHLFFGVDHIDRWISSTYRDLIILQVEEIESILDQYDVSRREFTEELASIDEQKNREMLRDMTIAYRKQGTEIFQGVLSPYALVDQRGRVVAGNDRLLADRAASLIETYPGRAFAVHDEKLHRYFLAFDPVSRRYLMLREDQEDFLEETRNFELTNRYRRESFLRGLEEVDRVDLIDHQTGLSIYSTAALGRFSAEERQELLDRPEGFIDLTIGSGSRRQAYLSYLVTMENGDRLVVSILGDTIEGEIRSVRRVIFAFLALLLIVTVLFSYLTYRMLKRHIDPMRAKGREIVRPNRALVGVVLFFALLQGFVSLQLMKNQVNGIVERHLAGTFEHYIEMKNDAGHASGLLDDYVVNSQREQLLLKLQLQPEELDRLTLALPIMQEYLERVYGERFALNRPQAFSEEDRLIVLIPQEDQVHLIERPLERIPELSMHRELDAYFSRNYEMRSYESLQALREDYPGWMDDRKQTKVYTRSGEEHLLQYRFNQNDGLYYVMGLPVSGYTQEISRTEMGIAGGVFTLVVILLFWRMVLQLLN